VTIESQIIELLTRRWGNERARAILPPRHETARANAASGKPHRPPAMPGRRRRAIMV
jgi:hypothetical protein